VSISIGSVQRINCPVSSAYQGPAFKLQFACCFCHALSCIVARPNLFAEQIGRRMQAKSDWTKKEKLPKAKKEKQRLWEARLNKLKPFQPEAIPWANLGLQRKVSKLRRKLLPKNALGQAFPD
jgi:hypothetical protein